MLTEHYFELLSSTAALVTELGEHGDPRVAASVENLLRQVDLLHREGLLRLVDALRAQGAGQTLDRIVGDDPVVRVLLGLYDLADLQLPQEAESAFDAAADVPGGFFPIEQLRVRRPAARADV